MIQQTRRMAQAPIAISPKKLVFAFVLMIAAVALFYQRVGQINVSQIWDCVIQISLSQWITAAFLTGVSFFSLGKYDAIWHRILGTNVDTRRAQKSGMAAIAIGQTAGFCAVTSGLSRWRSLPELDLAATTKVTAAVALSFMTCWAIIALPALWYLADQSTMTLPNPALAIALIATIGFTAARIANRHGVAMRSAAALLWWTACDLAAAAAALYVLLPTGLDVSFFALCAVFVLALGAAIMSNAPAGIGVFDVVLIGLLAIPEAEPQLAAILGFRLVYYIIPFGIGCLVVARSTKAAPTRRLTPLNAAVVDSLLTHQAPASWGLARQNGTILRGRNLLFFLADVPFSTVAIGDPLRARPDVAGHSQLQAHARQNGRLAAFYHVTSRMAVAARKDGWFILPVARRAFLDPQTWTSSGSRKQGLRRKLAQSEKACVTIRRVEPSETCEELDKIAHAWSVAHGGQMGFSMGTYCRQYVAHQAVFMINAGGQDIGFVTFNIGKRSWALDLIRYTRALPHGAMHAAVVTAITDAKADGATTFCLAAAPYDRSWQARLCKSRAGLTQFKQSFRPKWQTLYACAPNPVSMFVSAIAVIWAIQRPFHKALNWCAHGPKTQR